VPLTAPDGVDVHVGAGKARMKADNLALEDYFDIPNALFHLESPVEVDATCSFDIRWSPPVTERSQITSPAGSVGHQVLCQATMTWSASNALGFSFESDPAGTTSVFAQLGHVRNGRFAD
jgi:hypothetical protein